MEALWAIIGVVVGAVLPRVLDSRAPRQSDVREIRLALIQTRDLVWPPHSSTELDNYLTRTGAKLLDFNIASRVGDEVKTRSGTPPYQAPDADLTRWDVSTDLFAVGVMLYQLLCNGHHPYPGSKPMVGESVINPRMIRSNLDPELSEFLTKACAPYRTERFPTAAEMSDALRAVRKRGNAAVGTVDGD